jgi:DNA-binding MarR family transcriptional regulator
MVQISTRHEVAGSIDSRKIKALVALVQTAAAVDKFLDAELHDYGISKAKLLTMKVLLANGGTMTHTALSKELSRSKHTITVLVDGLERDGLVRREQHSSDRRSKNVVLTEKGGGFLKSTLPICDQIGYTAIGQIDVEQAEQLKALLDKIRQSVT